MHLPEDAPRLENTFTTYTALNAAIKTLVENLGGCYITVDDSHPNTQGITDASLPPKQRSSVLTGHNVQSLIYRRRITPPTQPHYLFRYIQAEHGIVENRRIPSGHVVGIQHSYIKNLGNPEYIIDYYPAFNINTYLEMPIESYDSPHWLYPRGARPTSCSFNDIIYNPAQITPNGYTYQKQVADEKILQFNSHLANIWPTIKRNAAVIPQVSGDKSALVFTPTVIRQQELIAAKLQEEADGAVAQLEFRIRELTRLKEAVTRIEDSGVLITQIRSLVKKGLVRDIKMVDEHPTDEMFAAGTPVKQNIEFVLPQYPFEYDGVKYKLRHKPHMVVNLGFGKMSVREIIKGSQVPIKFYVLGKNGSSGKYTHPHILGSASPCMAHYSAALPATWGQLQYLWVCNLEGFFNWWREYLTSTNEAAGYTSITNDAYSIRRS